MFWAGKNGRGGRFLVHKKRFVVLRRTFFFMNLMLSFFGDRNSHFDAVVRLFIGMEELRHSECWDSESILASLTRAD